MISITTITLGFRLLSFQIDKLQAQALNPVACVNVTHLRGLFLMKRLLLLVQRVENILGFSALILRNNRGVIGTFAVILDCVSEKKRPLLFREGCSSSTPVFKSSALLHENNNPSMCFSPLNGTVTSLKQYLLGAQLLSTYKLFYFI